MRKLMIAMLALAVVFGFAACDNSNSGSTSLMDKYVVALEVTGPETYFEGDKVDLADYKVVGIQNNGGRIDLTDNLTFTYVSGDATNGLDVTAASGNSKDAKEAVIGTISYDGIYVGTVNKPTAEVKATVYKLDAIGVTGPSVGQYFDTQDEDDFKASDYTITAYALAESGDTADEALYHEVIDVPADAVKDKFGLTTVLDTDGLFKTGNYTLTVMNGTAPITTGANEIKISVQRDELASLSLEAVPNVEIIVGTKRTSHAANTVANVVYTMGSGKVFGGVGNDALPTDYDSIEATVAWKSGTDTFAASGERITATVTVGSKDFTAPDLAIETTADYIEKFTITADGTNGKYKVVSNAMTVAVGTKLDAKELAGALSLTWASGSEIADKTAYAPTPEELEAALRLNGELTFDTASYSATQNVPLTFSLEGLDNIVTTKTKCEITTVTMAASVSAS